MDWRKRRETSLRLGSQGLLPVFSPRSFIIKSCFTFSRRHRGWKPGPRACSAYALPLSFALPLKVITFICTNQSKVRHYVRRHI